MEYATSMKKQMKDGKNYKTKNKKIILIQEWWKTMYKIIKLQKNVRGFLFRKKLMNKLEHQEKLLQFITEFDNIHNYHLYRQFMDKLKKKRDYEKAKLMEKCEDFNDKLDNLEKLHNLKRFKDCFKKWKDDTKKKRKQDLDRFVTKLNNILKTRVNKNKLNTLRKIKNRTKSLEDKLNDKAQEFREGNAKKKFFDHLKKAHRLNKILSKVKKKIDKRHKKDAFDKLKKLNDIGKGAKKLNDLMKKHAKKKTLDKLKDMNNKRKLKDKLKQWKDFNDEMKNRMKILNKLKRYKENELKKKAEQEKNKFAISSGVNDFELISDKKNDETPKKNNQVFSTSQNDFNFQGKPAPKMVFERAGQNFSLMAPSKTKFEFGQTPNKIKKKGIEPLNNQLDDLDEFKRKKDLKKYMDKWKELANKKDIVDKLKDNLNDLIRKQKQKCDKLKNVADNLKENKDKQDLKEYFDKWKNKADQMKKDSLDNLANKLNDILTKAQKESDDQIMKDILDKLKKDADIAKAVEKLDDLINKKPKKNALDTIKKNNEKKALEDLDKLLNKKLKQKYFDKLKKLNNLDKAAQTLDKIMNNKMKRDALKYLNKYNKMCKLKNFLRDKLMKKLFDRVNISKASDKLEKVFNDKLKKNAFDELKKANDIAKAADNLEKLLNDKLKKNALNNLKKMNKKEEDKKKKEALKKWKDIVDRGKIKDALLDKARLKKAFDKWKDIINRGNIIDDLVDKADLKKGLNRWRDIKDRGKIKDALVDKAKLKKAFDKWQDSIDRKDIIDSLVDRGDLKKAFNHWKKIKELRDIMDKLKEMINDDLLDKYINRWLDKCEQREIFDKLKNYLHKRKALNDWKKNRERKQILKKTRKYKILGFTLKKIDNKKLKKCLDKWREIAKDKPKSKRISRRTNSKKFRSRSKKSNDEKLLKKAFDKWRENLSFPRRRNVLAKIKKNKLLENLNDYEKKELLDKYKKKMMQVLLNIYKRQRHLIVKRYLDRWRRIKGPYDDIDRIEPKYKKKPKIDDRREYTDSEPNSFNPRYINPKKNLHNQKTDPYRKRYNRRPYEQQEEYNYEEPTEVEYNNINQMDKYHLSDTSSYNESAVGNGEYLIQNRKIIKQPRNYTSQSFFIDKTTANNLTKNSSTYHLNTHNTNQLPMTMKGDFISLIEQNPKILYQKNPRIQVTNATCELNQIINNENTEDELKPEEVNDEMDKLNKNYIINKNRVLKKVIKNCDKDLYASQKPFKAKKDQWFSVSIPLSDNEGKWEFLNNIRGERDKNNLNKFELIQKEEESIKEENEESKTPNKTIRTEKRLPLYRDTSYRLREMNYSQFYRTPIRTPLPEEEDLSLIGNRIRRPGDRHKTQKNIMSTSRKMKNSRNNIRNIERSRGKIELDPKYKTIDFDNGYGEYEDSDE